MLIRSIAIVIRADRAGRQIYHYKHSSLKFVDMMTLSKLMRPTRFDSRWVCRFVLALWQIDSNLYNENAAAQPPRMMHPRQHLHGDRERTIV